jgi:hypothetical protein
MDHRLGDTLSTQMALTKALINLCLSRANHAELCSFIISPEGANVNRLEEAEEYSFMHNMDLSTDRPI